MVVNTVCQYGAGAVFNKGCNTWHVNRESFVRRILVTPFLSFWIMSQYILLAKATVTTGEQKVTMIWEKIIKNNWDMVFQNIFSLHNTKYIQLRNVVAVLNRKSLYVFFLLHLLSPWQENYTLVSSNRSLNYFGE